MASPGGQILNLLLAEEITQVKEAIPWVRCASGNVYVDQADGKTDDLVGKFYYPTPN